MQGFLWLSPEGSPRTWGVFIPRCLGKMGTYIKTKGRPNRPPSLYPILYQDLSLYSIFLFLKIHEVIIFIYT